MLAALGMFLFDTDHALFEELARRRSWRHARTERFGAAPASQYLGPGDDHVTLSGALVPGVAGKYSAIETLVQMADSGDAFPLSDGTGRMLGYFTIEGIDETHRALIDNGLARQVDFTITLARAG